MCRRRQLGLRQRSLTADLSSRGGKSTNFSCLPQPKIAKLLQTERPLFWKKRQICPSLTATSFLHFHNFRYRLHQVGSTCSCRILRACHSAPQQGGTNLAHKVKKDGILESPKVEVFRRFISKRWSFERWRRAILLQEPGEFFYPSLIGDLLSPEHKTSTKTQFLFERMQLRSWILKLKTYISTTKCGRMKRL